MDILCSGLCISLYLSCWGVSVHVQERKRNLFKMYIFILTELPVFISVTRSVDTTGFRVQR